MCKHVTETSCLAIYSTLLIAAVYVHVAPLFTLIGTYWSVGYTGGV